MSDRTMTAAEAAEAFLDHFPEDNYFSAMFRKSTFNWFTAHWPSVPEAAPMVVTVTKRDVIEAFNVASGRNVGDYDKTVAEELNRMLTARAGAALPLVETAADEKAAALAEHLERWVERQSWWDDQHYGTRMYYGDGANDYVQRGLLQSAIACLRSRAATPDALPLVVVRRPVETTTALVVPAGVRYAWRAGKMWSSVFDPQSEPVELADGCDGYRVIYNDWTSGPVIERTTVQTARAWTAGDVPDGVKVYKTAMNGGNDDYWHTIHDLHSAEFCAESLNATGAAFCYILPATLPEVSP